MPRIQWILVYFLGVTFTAHFIGALIAGVTGFWLLHLSAGLALARRLATLIAKLPSQLRFLRIITSP